MVFLKEKWCILGYPLLGMDQRVIPTEVADLSRNSSPPRKDKKRAG